MGRGDLLRLTLIVQMALVLLVVLTLFVRSGLQRWFERRHGSALRAASAAVASTLAAEEVGTEAELRLSCLPRSLQLRLIQQFAPSLAGESLALLATLASQVGLLEWADHGCASSRWHRRLVAVRLLTLLRANRIAALPLLDDPHPLVRAQAIEWASDHADDATIVTMIAQFEAPSTLCLFTTQDSLLRIGGAAVGPLLEYLEADGTRALEPALVVAIGLAGPRLLPAAITLSDHPEAKIRAKAAALLGAIGGELPVARLMELRADGDGEVRGAAVRALGELGHWQSTAAIALLLRDVEYQVRREAGLALRAFGPPGQLMLRHCLSDPDHFAADRARQVLGLPGSPDPASA